jgi:hypothetical protein
MAMPDLSPLSTVELLTRAADAAAEAAGAVVQGAWLVVRQYRVEAVPRPQVINGLTYDWHPFVAESVDESTARLIAASGPDHWRAVEATFRRALELHQPVLFAAAASVPGGYQQRVRICGCCHRKEFPCETLGALGPLAEQVLRDLEDR